MSSYLPKGKYQIDIKEGCPRTVTLIVPVEIDMTARQAMMQVRQNTNSEVIITLDTVSGGIAKTGQTLILSFEKEDTLGRAGKWVADLLAYTIYTDAIPLAELTLNVIPTVTRLQ